MNPEQNEQKKNVSQVREWIQTIIIALIIALPIRYFIAEPFIVNGASMDPSFASGQFLIVDRLSYRFEEPKRGDVVVFKYPNNPSTYYIKRIIGLPGETIRLDNGKVTIINKENIKGITLSETYIDNSHSSFDTIANRELNNNQYFVMGDNRLESSDSRAWGPLENKYIIGRPIFRLFPLTKISIWPGEDHKNK